MLLLCLGDPLEVLPPLRFNGGTGKLIQICIEMESIKQEQRK
jgi:hypothetical protein